MAQIDHVLVRLAPGGGSYQLIVIDGNQEDRPVLSVHGPMNRVGRRLQWRPSTQYSELAPIEWAFSDKFHTAGVLARGEHRGFPEHQRCGMIPAQANGLGFPTPRALGRSGDGASSLLKAP